MEAKLNELMKEKGALDQSLKTIQSQAQTLQGMARQKATRLLEVEAQIALLNELLKEGNGDGDDPHV